MKMKSIKDFLLFVLLALPLLLTRCNNEDLTVVIATDGDNIVFCCDAKEKTIDGFITLYDCNTETDSIQYQKIAVSNDDVVSIEVELNGCE